MPADTPPEIAAMSAKQAREAYGVTADEFHRAVNSHDKLVEALKGYMSILNSSDATSDSKKAVQRRAALWKSATAVLREAEGRS